MTIGGEERHGIVALALKVCLSSSLCSFAQIIELSFWHHAALATYEPRIKAKVDSFVSHIQANEHKPVDATTWSMFLSFDIMGEVGFGKDFNNLSTGKENPAIKAIHDHMAILGVLSHVPWMLYLMSGIPGATAAYAGFFGWCGNQVDLKQKVISVLSLHLKSSNLRADF